jgi:hypothetical protein
MRLFTLLCAAVLALILSAAARALTNDQVWPQAIQIATSWLENNTQYKHIPPIGRRVLLSPEAMLQRGQNAHIPGDLRFLTAIYSCGENTLYLKDGVNIADVGVLSTLVHELTHHAQCLAHLPMNDTCRVEHEAYANEEKFLRSVPVSLARTSEPLSPDVTKKINDYAAARIAMADSICAEVRRR